MFAKLMNGRGMEMDSNWFHVPVYYTGIFVGHEKEVVVTQWSKNKVVYAIRNHETYRVGMNIHTKLFRDKSGEWFLYKGKKVYIGKYGHVF